MFCTDPSYWATRRTTLKSAPPLAKLLTRTIGPSAAVTLRVRRSAAASGHGSFNPAMGGTLPTAPQIRAAAQAALPEAPDSPSAPLIEVTAGDEQPKTRTIACASTRSSAPVAFADA